MPFFGAGGNTRRITQSGVEVNTSKVKLTTINNSLALDSVLYGRNGMDQRASCTSKLCRFSCALSVY